EMVAAPGHTLVQKLVYLLQEAEGLPFGYRFRLYYYGPYCAELWGDLNTLAELGYLTVEAKEGGWGYEIATTDLGRELVAEYQGFLAQFGPRIGAVLELLGGEPVRRLEVLATTFYVFRDRERKGLDTRDSFLIDGVRDLKPHLRPEEVSRALDQLRSRGLLQDGNAERWTP
ncbi:MAG: hypothetical protein H5T97_13210, partial [Firmicutes bacterium]|nr:hypothetical protein [Bacillota bacterium]